MQSSFGESYFGARERAMFEYIPTEEEISRILNESGLNLKWRAFFLVRVYPEMKKVVPEARAPTTITQKSKN